jgi:hypothetical protein
MGVSSSGENHRDAISKQYKQGHYVRDQAAIASKSSSSPSPAAELLLDPLPAFPRLFIPSILPRNHFSSRRINAKNESRKSVHFGHNLVQLKQTHDLFRRFAAGKHHLYCLHLSRGRAAIARSFDQPERDVGDGPLFLLYPGKDVFAIAFELEIILDRGIPLSVTSSNGLINISQLVKQDSHLGGLSPEFLEQSPSALPLASPPRLRLGQLPSCENFPPLIEALLSVQ